MTTEGSRSVAWAAACSFPLLVPVLGLAAFALSGPFYVFYVSIGSLILEPILALGLVCLAILGFLLPRYALWLLVFSGPLLPRILKELNQESTVQVYMACAALVGVLASDPRGIRDELFQDRSTARPLILLASLYLISTVVTALHYSPSLGGRLEQWLGLSGFLRAGRPGGGVVSASTVGMTYFFGLVLFVALLRHLRSEPVWLRRMLMALQLGLAATLALGVLQAYSQDLQIGLIRGHPTGFVTDAMALGAIVVLAVPLLIGLLIGGAGRAQQILAAGNLAMVLALLIPLQSRLAQGSIVGAAVSITGMYLFASSPDRAAARRPPWLTGLLLSLTILAIGAFSLITLLVAFPESDLEQHLEVFVEAPDAVNLFTDLRMSNNVQAVNMGVDHPVAGIGVGAFSLEIRSYWSSRATALPENPDLLPQHQYLQAFAETGVLGFGALIWLTAMVVYRLWAGLQALPSGPGGWLFLGAAAAVIDMLIAFNWGPYLLFPEIQGFFWLPVAVVYVLGAGTGQGEGADSGAGGTAGASQLPTRTECAGWWILVCAFLLGAI